MSARDDFNKPVKRQLADRVRHACSSPDCEIPTMGPDSGEEKTINIGVAAHITAAAPGGKRYDSSLTSEQRKNISNGIWLCQSCSKLIDSDERLFPVEKLRSWKRAAEQKCLEAIVSPKFKRSSMPTETSADLDFVKQLGLPVNIDLQAHLKQMIDAAKADLSAFKSMPSWPTDPVELDLKITGDQSSQQFDVHGLAAAIETFNEISVAAAPGTGKTTTLLQLAEMALEENNFVAVFMPLSEWSTQNSTFFECVIKRKAFQGAKPEHLMLLAHHGRLILILDGWNELDPASRRRAIDEIKALQRDFPDIRLVISSRQKEFDNPIFGPEVHIEELSEDQQLSIAKTLRGPEGEALMDHAWRTRGVRELVATPLYLMTLLAQTTGNELPKTKEEVLRIFVSQHENDAKKASLLRDNFEGCHREALTAIAVEAQHAATTSVSCSRARTILTETENKLKEEGQIKEFPKPVNAIDLLADLHMIVRTGGDEGSLSFQHHQFQEWYASFRVEELMIDAKSGDGSALKALREDMLNIPVWEEAILFACERLSRENQAGAEVVAFCVLETITIDPILSAEIIYRSSDDVWELTRNAIIAFIDKWHVPGKIDRAAQFMAHSGRSEFASYIWPLIADESNQVSLLTYADIFRPSVLGSDLEKNISELSEEKRKHVISDIASHSGMDGIELATKLALADESAAVKASVIEALQFRRADRFVSEILRAAPDEVWSLLAKSWCAKEIADPEASERLEKEQEKFMAEVADPFQKIHLLLNAGVRSSEIGQKIGSIIEEVDFSERQDNDRWALYQAHEAYPESVNNALIKQLEEGRKVPYGSEDFLQAAGLIIDEGPLVELVMHPQSEEGVKTTAAAIIGPKTVGLLIDQVVEVSAQMRASSRPFDEALSDKYYGLLRLISCAGVNPFIEAVIEREQTEDVHEIALLADLLARHGDKTEKEPLKLDAETHDRAVSVFNNWSEILLASSGATRAQFAVMARAIERLASPQLVSVLQKLLAEDLKRRELAKKEREGAQKQRNSIDNDAHMSCTLQYRRAFASIGDDQTIELMKSYLPDLEFGFDAACVLKSIWKNKQSPVENESFFKSWPDFSVVEDQRIERQSQDNNIETAEFVDDILATVDGLLQKDCDEKAQKHALQLAKIAFSMPYKNKEEMIDRLLELPLSATAKQDLLTVLVLAGEIISADLVLEGINDFFEEAKKKEWMLLDQGGRRWQLDNWLRLLPFSDRPEALLDALEKLDDRHKEPWKMRNILSALGHAPCAESEKILGQLAQQDERFLSEYDWLAALTHSKSIPAAQILLELVCDGSFLDQRGRADTSDLGKKLAGLIVFHDEFRAETYEKYQVLRGGKAKATLEYAIIEAADVDGVMLLVREAAAQNKSFDQTNIYSALRNILVGQREAVDWAGVQELYRLPAPDLRKRLFQMVINGSGAEEQLASECLVRTDNTRDFYGSAESEPRHPDIESGIPWPQINES